MCSPWLKSGKLIVTSDKQHQVAADWGLFKPQAGVSIAALSTGVAADVDDLAPAFVKGETPQPGTDFKGKPVAFPTALGMMSCVDVQTKKTVTFNDPATVHDLVELDVTLLVPTNARSYRLDVSYLSTDSPEYVCTQYDDFAMVVMDSANTKGNVLLDPSGARVNVNSSLFTLLAAKDLTGTGMDLPEPQANPARILGGGTGWLTLGAPVTPKETISLRVLTFDVVDAIYDSQLLVDHFRWSDQPLGCAGAVRAGDPAPCSSVDGGVVDASKD